MQTNRTVVALLAVAAVLTGCGQEKSDVADPTPPLSSTTEQASSFPASQTATAQPAGATTTADASSQSTTSTTPEPSASTIDLSAYAATGGAGKGHYFTSGALRCGITQSATGCQSTALVKNRPKCTDPDSRAPYVAIDGSEPSEDGCTTQGVFIAEKPAEELLAGQSLTVDDAACTVVATGSVTCTTNEGRIVANSEVFQYHAE